MKNKMTSILVHLCEVHHSAFYHRRASIDSPTHKGMYFYDYTCFFSLIFRQ